MSAEESILRDFRLALIEKDYCPECLGNLGTGWECNRCGYDAAGEVEEERKDREKVAE